jgi:uncharacterized lipoprotein YddW (UPF0748 family)
VFAAVPLVALAAANLGPRRPSVPAAARLPIPRLPLPLPVVRQPPPADARAPVVVVEGDFVGTDAAGLQAEAAKYARGVRQALEAACVEYEDSKDSTVEKWGLPETCQVAILPYNRAISPGELARLRAFIERDGKVIAFYVGPDELLLACGVRAGEVARAEQTDQYAAMKVDRDALPLLPETVAQSPWNIRLCEPLPGSRVIATWTDATGRSSGTPAVVLGEKGAFISHVFVPGDELAKGQLLRALVGHFVPAIWPDVARRELAQIDAVGRFGTLDRLTSTLQQRRQLGHRVDAPLGRALEAQAFRDAARKALAEGNGIAAVEASSSARLCAAAAFYATYPSKPGELRAAWMIYRGRPTWDETMRNLAAANFNAVMPRFCSAGVAYFPSNHLPLGGFAKEHGDQLAAAAEAAARYGVPVHARMLALFIYEAPPGVREAYARAGRLMVSAEGTATDWLCPTCPANRKLVVGACLEMATRYPVAGIQLDYIRYPWKTYCFCPTCRATFQRDLGVKVDQWPSDCLEGKYRGRFADWRREQLTSLVREISLRLKDARPGLQFSADVFINWETHRESFGQDWKAWVDEGLVDFVCPMDYTPNDETFASWVTRQRGWVNGRVPLCIGIGPRVEDCDLSPAHVLQQIETSRRLGGDGFVLFDYDEVLAGQHLPVIASGLSREPTAFTVGPPHLRCEASPEAGGLRLTATLATGASVAAASPREGAPPTRPLPASPPVVVKSAGLKLYTADAWPVLDLGRMDPDAPVSRDVELAPGSYRALAEGTLVRPGGQGEEHFVRWSQPVEVAD